MFPLAHGLPYEMQKTCLKSTIELLALEIVEPTNNAIFLHMHTRACAYQVH